VNENHIAKKLAYRTLLAVLAGSLLVLICYFFIDRPVAYFVYDHHLASSSILKWLTYPPPIVQTWAPLALAMLMILWIRGPLPRWARVVLAMGISIILADQFRESLAMVFGRYWPETWIKNNPSLIGDGSYGFHFFHEGSAFGSFPSGHEARTLALVSVLWMACPKWRWAGVLASLAVGIGLVGMNYHFVGDVIAGGLVGAIVGVYTAHFCQLDRPIPGKLTTLLPPSRDDTAVEPGH